MPRLRALALTWLLVSACGTTRLIPNTRVPDTSENREVIDVCERYRHALEARDSVTLLALASPKYWEDGGTPKPDDDYGYDGLRHVLADRLARLKSVRYEMEYRTVRIRGNRAEVDVYIDASFQLTTGSGDQYRHFTEYNRLELEYDGKRWLFTRGM
ncbi:MAG TPA: hypothetical protein VKN99_25685 [Polyangia bacterium]|nr:hypothetical protein [Polyangia bacterium]